MFQVSDFSLFDIKWTLSIETKLLLVSGSEEFQIHPELIRL